MDAPFASFRRKDTTQKSELQVKNLKKVKKTAEFFDFFAFFQRKMLIFPFTSDFFMYEMSSPKTV